MKPVDFSNGVKLAVPEIAPLNDCLPSPPAKISPAKIPGFKITDDNIIKSFVRSSGSVCDAFICEISYNDLLAYQRYINTAHYSERLISAGGAGDIVLYSLVKKHDGPLLLNPPLADMLGTRQAEWWFIPDIHAFFPVEYTDIEKIKHGVSDEYAQSDYETFLDSLETRTSYESGVKKSTDDKGDPLDFKSRIKRYYLGKLKIRVDIDSFDGEEKTTRTIGQPAYVDFFISIDIQSKCGVVSISSFSAPFLVSVLLDTLVNNLLLVCDEKLRWVNFYDYLSGRFSVFKRGTPKMYLTAAYKKDYLTQHQLASLLMAEMIFSPREGLGEFVDSEIMRIVSSEYGMGQYSRALVYASSNVLIQLGQSLQTSIKNRMEDQSVTFFYIELLMFEEASIQIANNSILNSISGAKNISVFHWLMNTHNTFRHFVGTMVFWDIQMNYPSSKKSVEMIRKAFQVDELIKRFERNQAELQIVFETKRDIIDRAEAAILNYIILFLTIVQCLPVFFPKAIFTNLVSENLARVLLICLLLFLYRQVKRFTMTRKFTAKH